MLLNKHIANTEKSDGICLLTFVVDAFLRLFLHPSIFFLLYIRDPRKWRFIRLLILIKSNIFVSQEGIITLQESLFSHTFFCS